MFGDAAQLCNMPVSYEYTELCCIDVNLPWVTDLEEPQMAHNENEIGMFTERVKVDGLRSTQGIRYLYFSKLGRGN